MVVTRDDMIGLIGESELRQLEDSSGMEFEREGYWLRADRTVEVPQIGNGDYCVSVKMTYLYYCPPDRNHSEHDVPRHPIMYELVGNNEGDNAYIRSLF